MGFKGTLCCAEIPERQGPWAYHGNAPLREVRCQRKAGHTGPHRSWSYYWYPEWDHCLPRERERLVVNTLQMTETPSLATMCGLTDPAEIESMNQYERWVRRFSDEDMERLNRLSQKRADAFFAEMEAKYGPMSS